MTPDKTRNLTWTRRVPAVLALLLLTACNGTNAAGDSNPPNTQSTNQPSPVDSRYK